MHAQMTLDKSPAYSTHIYGMLIRISGRYVIKVPDTRTTLEHLSAGVVRVAGLDDVEIARACAATFRIEGRIQS
eukprot:6181978-Pleurochrysis_carterae.AAC.3